MREFNPDVERITKEENIVIFKTKNKKHAIKIVEDIKFYLDDIFEEESNIKDYSDPTYWWK